MSVQEHSDKRNVQCPSGAWAPAGEAGSKGDDSEAVATTVP